MIPLVAKLVIPGAIAGIVLRRQTMGKRTCKPLPPFCLSAEQALAIANDAAVKAGKGPERFRVARPFIDESGKRTWSVRSGGRGNQIFVYVDDETGAAGPISEMPGR